MQMEGDLLTVIERRIITFMIIGKINFKSYVGKKITGILVFKKLTTRNYMTGVVTNVKPFAQLIATLEL